MAGGDSATKQVRASAGGRLPRAPGRAAGVDGSFVHSPGNKGVFIVVLATRHGEVLARLPLETQHPQNPDFDETECDDIPIALRKQDDGMTDGDMEFMARGGAVEGAPGDGESAERPQSLHAARRSSCWAWPSASGSRGATSRTPSAASPRGRGAA